MSKISSAAAGGAGLLAGTIQAGKRMAELPETEDKVEQEGAIQSLYGSHNASSYEELANLFDASKFARTNLGMWDLTGMSAKEAAGNIVGETFSQGMQGMQFGSQFGPWGALIGAAVGTTAGALSSGIGWGVRKSRAGTLAGQLNYTGKLANEFAINDMQNSAMKIGKNLTNTAWLNHAAFGGPLNTDFTNGVRFITTGGSHEQNPLSGVPQGIAEDGIPNLVEEGEVIYDDYVYSDRLSVPESDKEILGLKKGQAYTYAEAATQIQKESEERPNDPISKRNLDVMMGRLQNSQEDVKFKKQAQQLKRAFNKMTPDEAAAFVEQLYRPQQMQPMLAMQSMQPMQPTQGETPMFAKGGHLFAFGDSMTLPSFNAAKWYEDNFGFKNSVERALEAEAALRAEKLREAANIATASEVSGELPKTDLSLGTFEANQEKDNARERMAGSSDSSNSESSEPEETTNMGYIGAQALRTAPIWGNLMGTIAALADKPNYSNARRVEEELYRIPNVTAGHVGQRMIYNPIDINYLSTQAANQGIGARRALVEYGAGSPSGTQQAIVANNYAAQIAAGQNLLNAIQGNRNNLLQALEFNRGTDTTNVSNDLHAAMANQRIAAMRPDMLYKTALMRDAELAQVQNNRSTQLTSLSQQLGNLGTDMLNRKMAQAMAESYGVTYNDAMREAALAAFLQNLRGGGEATQSKNGGKLNTKKGGKHA